MYRRIEFNYCVYLLVHSISWFDSFRALWVRSWEYSELRDLPFMEAVLDKPRRDSWLLQLDVGKIGR